MMQVISAYDPLDPASQKMLSGDYLGHLIDDMEGRKIALGVGEYIDGSDPEVVAAVCKAAKVFEAMGCKVQEVNVDWLREAALANKTMTQSDGAAVHRDRLKEHPEMFGDDIRRRLEDGAKTTSTEYILARRTQAEVKKRLELFFEAYDFVLTPTTPIAAPTVEAHDAIEQAGRLTRFTAPFNLAGLPAISVPCRIHPRWIAHWLADRLTCVGGFQSVECRVCLRAIHKMAPASATAGPGSIGNSLIEGHFPHKQIVNGYSLKAFLFEE